MVCLYVFALQTEHSEEEYSDDGADRGIHNGHPEAVLVCSLVVETVYAEKDEYCAAVRERIERKIAAVVKYAQLAKQWGFDGVEIHGHHWGYLLDQFAMAYTNHRTDEYGGDLDGRLTFARKIITGIKEACGKDYPVSMRLCMKTYMKGYNQPSLNGDGEVGRDIDEAIEIAKRYEQYGVDMINCNTGSYDAFFYCVSPYYLEKGYNVEYARKLKAALNIPVIVAGAMDDPDICEEAVESGAVDGISPDEFEKYINNARTTSIGYLFNSDSVILSDEDCMDIYRESYK